MLIVRGLTKKYGDRVILHDIDLDLAEGRAMVVTGANGSGKSTLLRCITGSDPASEGTVEFDGQPLDERKPEIRRALAVVMDDLDFFPDLSVVEHLDLFAGAHQVPDAEQVVNQVLADVGLIAQSGQLPGTLSSGQRRRLALASALVRPKRLLVLDEPEQRLDVSGVDWLAERLNAEKAAGLSILFASHSPALIDAVADDVLRVGDPS